MITKAAEHDNVRPFAAGQPSISIGEDMGNFGKSLLTNFR